MIRFSKKMLFATEAVLDIAYNGGGVAVQSREITERQGIPRRYLEPVLQQMVRAGLLDGERGPRGGYKLGRPAGQITMADISAAVEATEHFIQPDEFPEGSELGHQVVRPLCSQVLHEVDDRLAAISMLDLCSMARKAGVDPLSRQKAA